MCFIGVSWHSLVVLCCCLSTLGPLYAQLVLTVFFCCSPMVSIPFLCFVVARQHSFGVLYWCFLTPLLCFVGARWHSLAMICRCSSTFPCWALLVLIVTPLLRSISVCCHFLDALYWCSLTPLCYIMLVFIVTPLLCYVGAHQHIFIVFC